MSIVFNDNILETDPNENAINLTTANNDVVISPNVHITATGVGSAGIYSTLSGQTLTVSGGAEISGRANGVYFSGGNAVHNSGKITGAVAVVLGNGNSAGNQLVNDGEITSTSHLGAVQIGLGSVINRGTLNGYINANFILNTNGLRSIIQNSGTINPGTDDPGQTCIGVSGPYHAVDITNTGLINGVVRLSDALDYGDVYDGRIGRITGTVKLQAGNDKAYGNARYAETFEGDDGNDTIDGGGGNDVALYAGAKANYTLSTVNGVTTIADTVANRDGTDTLKGVRFAKFTDQTVVLSNAAPDSLNLSTRVLAETAQVNTPVLSLSARDADGDALTYSLVDPSGTFKLDGGNLVLVRGLDYEAGARQVAVTLDAKDAYGGRTSQVFTIDIANVVEENPLTLFGTTGRDTLAGENGSDRFYGGIGNDTLTGALGHDVFVFDAKLAKTNTANKRYNLDRITDFSVKDDTIHLKKSVFKGITKKGVLSKGAFYASTKSAAHDADDRIIYNKKTGALLYDRDGSDHHYGAIQIATLSTKLGLKNTDFFVI